MCRRYLRTDGIFQNTDTAQMADGLSKSDGLVHSACVEDFKTSLRIYLSSLIIYSESAVPTNLRHENERSCPTPIWKYVCGESKMLLAVSGS